MASVRLGRDTRRQIHRAAMKAYDIAVTEPKLDNNTIETVWRGVIEHPSHIAFSNFVTAHRTEFNDLCETNFTPRKSDKVTLRWGERQSEEFDLPTERESWLRRGYYNHEVFIKDLHLSEVDRLLITDKITDLAERRKQARDNRKSLCLTKCFVSCTRKSLANHKLVSVVRSHKLTATSSTELYSHPNW
jgi:hypothetical protein